MDHDAFYQCPEIEDQECMFRWLANADLVRPGIVLEFGVATGRTLAQLVKHFPNHSVYGFDSFQGLPEAWDQGGIKGATYQGEFACDPPKVDGACIIQGWFADTLKTFPFDPLPSVSLLHIDCDLYSSTQTVLQYCWTHLAAEAIIICDEYRFWNDDNRYPNWLEHEARAMTELGRRLNELDCALAPLIRGTKCSAAFRLIRRG